MKFKGKKIHNDIGVDSVVRWAMIGTKSVS